MHCQSFLHLGTKKKQGCKHKAMPVAKVNLKHINDMMAYVFDVFLTQDSDQPTMSMSLTSDHSIQQLIKSTSPNLKLNLKFFPPMAGMWSSISAKLQLYVAP